MRKTAALILTLLLSLMYTAVPAYAGNINSYEQEVISAAQRTFVYNGANYKLAPSYIGELKNKLMADDIDLTEEQKDTVMGMIDGYIESGVEQGYLVPVEGQDDQNNSGSDPDNSSEADNSDTSSDTEDSSNTDEADSAADTDDADTPADTEDTDSTVDIDNDDTTSDSNDSDTSSDISQQDSTSVDSSGSANADTQQDQADSEDNVEEMIEGLFGDSGNEDKDASAIDNEEDSDSEDAGTSVTSDKATTSTRDSETTVIKDTGFDLSQTFIVIIMLGVIMLIGVIVTVRYKYFAHYDES